MILKCIGSGSSGNCYLLENDTECLVIEAGVPFKEIKKALNFNISKIVGVICTHSHADHSGRAYEYEAVGIPVLKPYEQTTRLACLGGFEITAFDLTDRQGRFMHSNSDGSECPCYGFYIIHPEMGSMVYATDCELIKWRFGSNVNHILVEANYAADLIDPDAANRAHVLTGHLELQTTLDFLRANNSPELRTVTLCHLSECNSDEIRFMTEAEKAVDPGCRVAVAKKGISVDVSLVPF